MPMTYHSSPPVLSTLNDLGKLWGAVNRLHRHDAFQITHCRSYLTALIGLKTKKKFGTKFLFDMRGFWADERVEGGIWNLKNPLFKIIYKWFKQREKVLLKEADHIVSLTHKAKDIMNAWQLKEQPLPITVIPCCVDLALFDPAKIKEAEQEALRNQLGIQKEDFVLTYIGSLGTWYMVGEMVEYFVKLLEEKPTARFLIVTKDEPGIAWKAVKKQGLDAERIIISPAPREQMPLFISLSAYSIFFIRPTFSKNASSPTKMGEIMAMGVPIIANAGIGDSDEYITQESGALIDLEKMTHKVESNYSEEDIRTACSKIFSLRNGVSDYRKIYAGL